MWLLNTNTLELQEFNAAVPPYAILSHTWGNEEVAFKEMRKYRESVQNKSGFLKIQQCCVKAKEDGFEWAWIDSCSIDKRSSAELSEAINSMFKWYERAEICYAYLEDVPSADGDEKEERLSRSRWFRRGWTLQELIAPKRVQFYAKDWSPLGVKSTEDYDFTALISRITGIDPGSLLYLSSLRRTSIAMRMSWAAERETTREEDRAYSLMGIFDVHMPILYGEGLERAFERLQVEIMSKSSDQSIFAWRVDKKDLLDPSEGFALLATSPSCFKGSRYTIEGLYARIRPFTVTNIGIRVTVRMHHRSHDIWIATLRCLHLPDGTGEKRRVQVFLRERQQFVVGSGIRIFQRVFPHVLEEGVHENIHVGTRDGTVLDICVPSPDQVVYLERAGCLRTLDDTIGSIRRVESDVHRFSALLDQW
jgi:hypothetical protein